LELKMPNVDSTDARLSTHEEVCALRYEQINARLKRLEGILIKACGTMLVAMAGVVYSSVMHLK
jgi:hypothetical protein